MINKGTRSYLEVINRCTRSYLEVINGRTRSYLEVINKGTRSYLEVINRCTRSYLEVIRAQVSQVKGKPIGLKVQTHRVRRSRRQWSSSASLRQGCVSSRKYRSSRWTKGMDQKLSSQAYRRCLSLTPQERTPAQWTSKTGWRRLGQSWETCPTQAMSGGQVCEKWPMSTTRNG